jgi:hypothetical protein
MEQDNLVKKKTKNKRTDHKEFEMQLFPWKRKAKPDCNQETEAEHEEIRIKKDFMIRTLREKPIRRSTFLTIKRKTLLIGSSAINRDTKFQNARFHVKKLKYNSTLTLPDSDRVVLRRKVSWLSHL